MTQTTHATFVIERAYKHSPAKVFAAWADAKAKRAWFAGGDAWEILSFSFDFREGGKEIYSFKSVNAPDILGNDTTFNDIKPNERLIFTYAMDRNGIRFSVSLACVDIITAGAGSRVIYTEHGIFFDGAKAAAMREAGCSHMLEKLNAYLSA